MNSGPKTPQALQILGEPETAIALLKEPRRRILELVQERPLTAVELAERLGEPRQRIGYHVRQLSAAGLLRETSRSQRGSVLERRYTASARGYGLSPDLLGPLAAGVDGGDAASAAHLLGAVHQVQRDVAAALERGASDGSRVPTLTLSTQVRFRDQEQRAAFASALKDALTLVLARHALPHDRHAGDPETADAEGAETFRMTLTLNPSEP